MTHRLDRADAFLREFDAHIEESRLFPAGTAVRLDRSAFYPSAGGQPNDLGTLTVVGDSGAVEAPEYDVDVFIDVVDVFEAEGAVWHMLAAAPTTLPLGAAVRGRLAWPRRFDHMQQHSGQHLLSQAFARRTGLDTIAVHIGAQECTLDLPAPAIATAVLDAVEDDANAVVYEDRPLRIYEVDEAEVARLPLRSAPKVRGRIRIVEIEAYDWSACGGTHVRSTGQIGSIKLLRTEKRADATRVTFLCGGRALRDYRAVQRDALDIAAGFSVARADLPAAVARLRDDARAASKAQAALQAQLAEFEARDLLAAARTLPNGWRIVAAAWDDRDAAALRAMAKRLTGEDSVIALLGAAGERANLCFARSRDADVDVSQHLRTALQALGGARGGGARDFAQGGGLPADRATLHLAIEQRIQEIERAAA